MNYPSPLQNQTQKRNNLALSKVLINEMEKLIKNTRGLEEELQGQLGGSPVELLVESLVEDLVDIGTVDQDGASTVHHLEQWFYERFILKPRS